jgi:F-type H+-transporting ATPase subunit b
MERRTNRFKSGLMVITLVAVMVAAGTVYASEAATGHTWWGLSVEKLWDLLWRTLNFAALIFILVKFGAKPVANVLNSRQLAIKEQFEDLESRRADADKSYQVFEEKLAQIDQEIKKIIENAITLGEAEKTRIITEAERAAADMKRQAEMAIQHEISAAKLKLREEVANQAALMAEELIRKSLQPADQVKLVEEYLEKVGTIQ